MGYGVPPSLAKEKLEFNLTHLFALQSQCRNFKMYLQMHPIETKGPSSSTSNVSHKTHSVYDITEIKNHWTAEDQKREMGEVVDDKLDLFSIYDPSKFSCTKSSAANKGEDNVKNRTRMTVELEKLMREELERLVDTAVETFSKTYLDCTSCKRTHSKCMTPTLTSMFVDLHLEMRQAIPIEITQWIVDNWLKSFDKVNIAYQRECAESGGACDKTVEVKRKLKETWVCNFSCSLSLLGVLIYSCFSKM
jgi:hypothetical protein